jgi:predicted SprT family Zn-dependent metalloprotease
VVRRSSESDLRRGSPRSSRRGHGQTMKRQSPDGREAAWQSQLVSWCRLWGVPDLADRIQIIVSLRLRRSLASYRTRQGEIRISSLLLNLPDAVLNEVLCHEAAHAAVAELQAHPVRPHGPEWRALVRAAGFEPSVRMAPASVAGRRTGATGSRALWEHRCPVCQMHRLARRPVRRWRCASCRRAGLDGVLVITRIAGAEPQQ